MNSVNHHSHKGPTYGSNMYLISYAHGLADIRIAVLVLVFTLSYVQFPMAHSNMKGSG